MNPLTDPRIGANNQPALSTSNGIVLAPQKLKSPAVQEKMALNNTETKRNPIRISRTGVDGTTPVHSVISVTSTPVTSGISGTRIIGTSTPDPSIITGTITASPYIISGTSASPPSGGIWSPIIRNIRQSASPNVIKSDESNASIDRKFSNNPIAPPVITQ